MPFRYGRWCKQKLFGMTNIELEEEEEEKELAIAPSSTSQSGILSYYGRYVQKCPKMEKWRNSSILYALW